MCLSAVTKINLRRTSYCNSCVKSILELQLFVSLNNRADFIKKILKYSHMSLCALNLMTYELKLSVNNVYQKHLFQVVAMASLKTKLTELARQIQVLPQIQHILSTLQAPIR